VRRTLEAVTGAVSSAWVPGCSSRPGAQSC
jgi:hypothetical protein